MTAREVVPLEHSALGRARGLPPGEVDLSDRQRLAVLLQASALLCHLRHCDRRLVGGWEDGRIDSQGMLAGLRSTTGEDTHSPQARLRELAKALFRADRKIAGRGEVRRTMRRLLAEWSQELMPLSPDSAVQQILDRASFLWLPSFRRVRSTLAGAHRWNGSQSLWVAGPEWFRNPLLEKARTLGELEDRLASADAEDLWRGNRRCPRTMAERGRWRAAVAAWRARSRSSPDDRLRFAHTLFAVGRFREALEEVAVLRRAEARALRLGCLHRLGELRRAARVLRQLETVRLDDELLLETAAIGVRVYGNLGETERALAWRDRALAEVTGARNQAVAQLVGFAAAWDRGEKTAMEGYLAETRSTLAGSQLEWKWLKAKGLEAISYGEGSTATKYLAESLRQGRRQMTPLEAGDLWNEMAVARSLCGGLHGAERALLHTLALHRDVEGPRKTTLALFNLAEIRLRRGRLEGVADILELSSRENRSVGNWRGIVHDTELWVRFDLVRGRPGSALDRIERVGKELRERGVDWRRDHLRALEARTLGMMGMSEQAARALDGVGEDAIAEFEPEERPALWALAGDRRRALQAIVAGDEAESFWSKVLSGSLPSDEEWNELRYEDGYRLARLVLDLETVLPGSAPERLRRRSARIFRRVGASVLAQRLACRGGDNWRAIARCLEQASGNPDSALELFRTCGYGDVRLTRRSPGAEDELLIDGSGGVAEVSANHGDGELVLSSPWVDPVLRSLLRVVALSLGERAAVSDVLPPRDERRSGIVGTSRSLTRALERLEKLAPGDVPVLLLGETGTGKELAARHVHAASTRSASAFLPINCAAVSEELLMSDLFGHVRGAYTGAVRDRVGVFEAAREGTVFLDEIGDLPLRAQGFLLRVLQEGEVRRVGESVVRSTDARVVAATHRDLEAMVRDGSFRADLYYRLRVASIELPPLRDRGSDVILLAEHFLRKLRPASPPRLGKAARSALLGHGWPGNVRELENVLSVAVAVAGKSLLPEHLDLPGSGPVAERGYHEMVLDFRRSLIRDALDSSGGNRAEAARALGLTRQALSYLARKLEI